MNVYTAAMQVMKPHQIDHHRSDLYLLMTNESLQIVNRYRSLGGEVDQVCERETGLYWYFIPWGYMPYWQRHFRFITENFAWEFIDRNEHTHRLRDWSNENLCRTFASMKTPPPANLYPGIRSAISSILSAHRVGSVNPMLSA